jgi:uncharacterized protein YqeY
VKPCSPPSGGKRKTAAAYESRGRVDQAARLRAEIAIIARLWPEPASRGD